MRLIFGTLLTLAIAAAVGLGLTWFTVASGMGFGAITIGAWTAQPKTGTSDIDPYARAVVVRSGQLPIGTGDGIAFIARTDENGRPLDGRCDISVSGTTPAARFWTLTIYDEEGRLIGNSVGRHGYTSQEVVRQADGRFEVRLAPRARAGNWLPTGGIERYVLIMRLHDTPVGVATRTQRDAPMPNVVTVGCP